MAKKRPSRQKYGDQFPLLIYAPLRRWRSLGLLTTLVSVGFWFATPTVVPEIGNSLLRHSILLIALAGLGLFGYGELSRSACVQCRPRALLIRTPLYPLTISYRRIEATRPVQISRVFDYEKEKTARKRWPPAYWGLTAVAVEIKGLPPNVSAEWLRLWFDRYLFLPDMMGFLFLVDDWMALSRQLNARLSKDRTRRQ